MAVEIKLTKGYIAIVDDEDADLADVKWHAIEGRSTTYACRTIVDKTKAAGCRNEYMHRIVLSRVLGRSLDTHELVDHWDHIGTNNQRYNLRPASKTQNNANSLTKSNSKSGIKGVSFHKTTRKWRASIGINRGVKHLGLFDTAEAAHRAYLAAALHYFGEFANDGTQSLAHLATQQESK
jgi:hypothetical protein